MSKTKGFTLIEVMLVVIISGSLLTTIYGIMTTLPRIKNFNDARQALIQQTNDIMDRFAILFQDYTIDYEEYFNRKMVGCGTEKGSNFKRSINTNGYCNNFTAYGNENAKLLNSEKQKQHHMLYCSSDPKEGNQSNLLSFENCKSAGSDGTTDNIFGTNNQGKISYGQYKQLFRDVKNDTDNQKIGIKLPGEVGDSDDRDEGKGPIAIGGEKNIQELYLISHDGTRRLYLRKKVKQYTDNKGSISTGSTIQILKLRGFDAGEMHNFDAQNDSEVYDGQIDTRACDYGQHFVCKGAKIPNYQGYNLPSDKDDGWVDLFDDQLNIVDWNIEIAPIKNPEYAWAEENQQINPYVQITLTAELSQHLWGNKLGGETKGYQYILQNVYDTKGFYLK